MLVVVIVSGQTGAMQTGLYLYLALVSVAPSQSRPGPCSSAEPKALLSSFCCHQNANVSPCRDILPSSLVYPAEFCSCWVISLLSLGIPTFLCKQMVSHHHEFKESSPLQKFQLGPGKWGGFVLSFNFWSVLNFCQSGVLRIRVNYGGKI